MLEHAHRGMRQPPMRWAAQPPVAALARLLVPALQRGRGRAQQHLGAFEPAAVDGQVARRIARAFLLLVAAGRAPRRPRSAAAAACEANTAMRVPSTMRAAPLCAASQLLQALRVGHAAVQRDHARRRTRRKARGEARLELRRQVDLGHHAPAPARPASRASSAARSAGRPRSCRCRWRRTAGTGRLWRSNLRPAPPACSALSAASQAAAGGVAGRRRRPLPASALQAARQLRGARARAAAAAAPASATSPSARW